MTLERKLFYHEPQALPASTNLAINQHWFEHVRSGAVEAVIRIYRHQPAVILGRNQNERDVNTDACSHYGYEVTRRVTGGAAIVANPDLALCYSIVCSTPERDPTVAYKRFTIPLAKHFGHGASVEGTYYLKVGEGERRSLAGHALHMSRDIMQLDGIVHLQPIDADFFSKLIHTRELYESPESKYVKVGSRMYEIRSNELHEVTRNDLRLVRSERDELALLPSLESMGASADDFTTALYRACTEVLGDGWSAAQSPQVKQYHAPKKTEEKAALGHCFIYIGATEKNGVHYAGNSRT